jgi:hypothetical protein
VIKHFPKSATFRVLIMDKNPKVLIVNDDPSQLHLTSCILTKNAYQIWAALGILRGTCRHISSRAHSKSTVILFSRLYGRRSATASSQGMSADYILDYHLLDAT